jgi:cytochrome c553
MKIHGYCDRCHKIKLVHASNAAMVRLAMNQPIFGTCDACHADEVREAKDRHPAYRRGNNV